MNCRPSRFLLNLGAGLSPLLVGLVWWGAPSATTVQDDAAATSEFSRASIGVVVSDVARSVDFYTKALGFKEVPGFSVPGEFCRKAGLTDGHALTVRVLMLGEGDGATRLKLMNVPKAGPAPAKLDFVHSQLGLSYITLHVKNSRGAVSRLKKAGGTLISKGIVPIDPSNPEGVCLSVLRDPDGNIVELVGPRG